MHSIASVLRTYNNFFNEFVSPVQAVGYIVGENVVPFVCEREYHSSDIICPEGAVFTRAMCDKAIQCGVLHVLVWRKPDAPVNDGTDPDKPVPEHLGGFFS